jgi:hypothetical protein
LDDEGGVGLIIGVCGSVGVEFTWSGCELHRTRDEWASVSADRAGG